MKRLVAIVLTVICVLAFSASVFAEAEPAAQAEGTTQVGKADNTKGTKAIAAAIVVAVVAAAGAIGMALAISKSVEGMARQPEIAGKINSAMMLGLVFIETAIIYALIVAILVIFVL